ncbi:MOXD1-like 1 [Papilio machaon]|uniref:MOXD1-like 1 n=1 Tax=Papilio machaon TaxID=76193 RepID=A0A0N1IHW1_PAPMA|nr:MOXD1-like 1 [Papilio machaon]
MHAGVKCNDTVQWIPIVARMTHDSMKPTVPTTVFLAALNFARVPAQNTMLGVPGFSEMRREGTAQRADDPEPPIYSKRVGLMIPDDGITIVSVLLHAHGTAKKISLKHIRGNNELPKVSEENSYDVRYQQSRIVPGGRKFLKGDTLITECTYDSTGRDKPILGGDVPIIRAVLPSHAARRLLLHDTG